MNPIYFYFLFSIWTFTSFSCLAAKTYVNNNFRSTLVTDCKSNKCQSYWCPTNFSASTKSICSKDGEIKNISCQKNELEKTEVYSGTEFKEAFVCPGLESPKGVAQAAHLLAKVYLPLYASMNQKLHVRIDNGLSGTHAKRESDTDVINVSVQDYMSERMSKVLSSTELSSWLLCHEIGHHLGGNPLFYIERFGGHFSAEGQADYYATLVCLRQLFKNDSNLSDDLQKWVTQYSADQKDMIDDLCKSQFQDEESSKICVKSLSISITLQRITRPDLALSIDTPDETTVSRALTGVGEYPSEQCRLDTAIAGALCPLKPPLNLKDSIELDECSLQPSHFQGARPKCWFKN